MRNEATSPELIEAEVKARRQKEEARKTLHQSMARALGPPPEPPALSKPVR